MTLYAVDEDDFIHASDAANDKIYWCLDCFGPLKRRKGKWRFAHFYHLKTTPSCRLYSKSVDHLVAQMELQRSFAKGLIQVERPFLQVNRVADACFEKEKIVFEIQCSPITEKEAEMRIHDYQSMGYDVVWLLDDKRYNKRISRPAEEFLRRSSTYFLSIRRNQVYDQFEVFQNGKRVRKSKPLPINLSQVLYAPKREFGKEFPEQIIRLNLNRHFYQDRLYRAIHFPLSMHYERALELQFAKNRRKEILLWLKKYIVCPYIRWLERFLRGR